jgi:Fe-S oxidoreductase
MEEVAGVSPEQYRPGGARTAYHSPCHLCRGMGVTEAPRKLMEHTGLEYVACDEEDVCCGLGGTYSTEFPRISAELLKKKLDRAEEAGAELLVTDCPGCVLQLAGGAEKRGGKLKVKHIAEAIADRRKKSE